MQCIALLGPKALHKPRNAVVGGILLTVPAPYKYAVLAVVELLGPKPHKTGERLALLLCRRTFLVAKGEQGAQRVKNVLATSVIV